MGQKTFLLYCIHYRTFTGSYRATEPAAAFAAILPGAHTWKIAYVCAFMSVSGCGPATNYGEASSEHEKAIMSLLKVILLTENFPVSQEFVPRWKYCSRVEEEQKSWYTRSPSHTESVEKQTVENSRVRIKNLIHFRNEKCTKIPGFGLSQ